MFTSQKKTVICGVALLSILLIGLAFHGAGVLVQGRMEKFLARHGIGEASISSFGHGSGDQVMFSDIKLDPDGFSTIGAITARVRWPFILSSRPFSEIIINKLALTGEMDENGNVTIAGLKLAALPPLAETDSLILDSGQIDLSTPVGAIRLELKDRMTRQPDGSQKFEAAVWGKQFQLDMDTRWNGQIFQDGKWSLAGELREARLNLPHIAASRISGWLSASGTFLGIGALSGEVDAGQLRIGEKTVIGDGRLTIDGPYASSHIIARGNVTAYDGMIITADMNRSNGKMIIHASVEAKKTDDLISFLQNLHTDMALAAPHSTGLTTLLLTPGNLERIRTAATGMTYDSAELVVDGTAGNLTGKIVTHRNGSPETGVISLNPGTP